MEQQTNLDSPVKALKDLASNFHKILLTENIYTENISQEQFNNLTNNLISDLAGEILNDNKLLQINMKLLPLWIVYQLHEYLNFSTWDFEFGIGYFMDELKTTFEKSKFSYSWDYNESDKILSYSLDSIIWKEKIESLDSIEPELTMSIIEGMKKALNNKGFTIIDIVTGDQTAAIMLIPGEAENNLKDFLITSDGPERCEEIYQLLNE